MLEQTFIHIPGVGPRTEQKLWKGGIRSWDDADRFERRFGVVGARLQKKLDEYLPRSRDAIKRRDAAFFKRLSALGESWRVFPAFADKCVYLDIETTGLSTVFDSVTIVGTYDGRKYRVFVEGDNLPELAEELQKYSVMVTFNGSGFDLRFLKQFIPETALPPIHVDLRWVTRRLGMHGGLKEIETTLKIRRADQVKDLDGHDATVLWAKHLRGDKKALDRLIQYNTEDVVHLKAIMEITYDRLCEQTATFTRPSDGPLFEGVAPIPKWRGRNGISRRGGIPDTTIVDCLLRRSGAQTRVVGIDLTGSARRSTGWGLIVGREATTKAIREDDDLIQETIAAKPDVVSIDSPLSLPEGWNDRTTHNESPIYRKCELALKRMGISVFWCLLPSMRALTHRGMRLAVALRESGLKVIESYPGAAQDLLGIPRKGSSLEELKWGLRRAGIVGDYISTDVTHDEVDAITSALVGLFYLADDYIALGTPPEDYLIVPRTPRMNYARLDEILSSTGLDRVCQAGATC
jgi:uncharacterized protein YprB with RNaseH-like and TPR domain/predicted nuclease with RNAse H fold